MVSVTPCESNYCTFTLQGSLFWFPCPELYSFIYTHSRKPYLLGILFLLLLYVNALANTTLHIHGGSVASQV